MTTLLYIEDNEAIRQLVRLILSRRSDIEMFEAETGKEGLRLAFTIAPDLLLIDITLPDMTGSDVLKQLREQEGTATIPAIAISGNAIEDTRHTAPGFDAYLAKPVNIKALYAAIDSLIG